MFFLKNLKNHYFRNIQNFKTIKMSSILGKDKGRTRDEAIDLTNDDEDVKRSAVERQVVDVVDVDNVEEEEEHSEDCDGSCFVIKCVNEDPVRTCLDPEVCVACFHQGEVDDQRFCGVCQEGNTVRARVKQQNGFSHMVQNPDRDLLLEYLRFFLVVECQDCSSPNDLRPTCPGQLEFICDSCESESSVFRCDQRIEHMDIAWCGRYDKTVEENDGNYSCKQCRSFARANYLSR